MAGLEDELTIPYEKFSLDNGLMVIVSEDHRAPLVNVRVWYHVGSKQESISQRSFSHLFEHIMFGRTEHMDQNVFEMTAEIGAVLVDANNGFDRTNYFETVPTSALDAVLWMESERMGYPLFTQETLEKERAIVFNEERMHASRPDRQIREATHAGAYPKDHPYAKVASASEDLKNATPEDLYAWHCRYYGAANAALVITGDVTFEEVRRKVEKYFAEIPPGPPVPKIQTWISKHDETRHRHIYASVSVPRLRMAWNVPPWGSAEADYLDLTRRILTGDGATRLRRRLIEEEQLATKVEADLDAMEISSLFIVDVTAREGADRRRIESVVQEEITRFAEEGPSPEALQRAQAQHRLAFAKEIQRLGRWWDGTSNVLARGQVFRGDPGHYRTMLRRIQAATAADLQQTAHTWLTNGTLVLDVLPQPSFTASAEGVDRSEMPDVGSLPDVSLPDLTHRTLENGLEVIFVPREGSGLVKVSLVMPGAGYAADRRGRPGTARLVLSLLAEEEGHASSDHIAERLGMLGAEMSTQGSMAAAQLSLTALRSGVKPALALFSEALTRPVFSEAAIKKVRDRQEAMIKEAARAQVYVAMHFFPPLLYGNGHPYGQPFTGRGTASSLGAITRADLVLFYRQHYRPDDATLIVAGDLAEHEAMPLLRETFGDWQASGSPAPEADLPAPEPAASAVYLLDQPGAERSAVYAAQLVPAAKIEDNRAAFEMMRYMLGSFNLWARLMRNLREEKGWTYRAFLLPGTGLRGAEPLIAFTPVQTDKTAEAMWEIVREWQALGHHNPVTPKELTQAKKAKKMDLAGDLETLETMTHLISERVAFGLPDDYYETHAAAFDRLTPSDVTAVAHAMLNPEKLIWLVIGDLEEIEAGIRALGLGEVHILDEDLARPRGPQ